MKAILLGSSGFWKEMEIGDYPPTLYVPWVSSEISFSSPDTPSIKMYDTLKFHRVATSPELQGAPRLVVYMQESPK